MPTSDNKKAKDGTHHHYKRTIAGGNGATGHRFSYLSAKRTSKGFHMCNKVDVDRSKYQCDALAMRYCTLYCKDTI